MKKDLPVAPKPDPENPLIRALRMTARHLEKRYMESGRISLRDAWYACKEEIEREISHMNNAGEASS